MYLRKGDIIKHDKNMDLCYEIMNVQGPYGSKQKYIVKTEIINMCFVKSYYIQYQCKFKIYKKDWKDWNLCSEPNRKCLRKGKWIKL